MRFYFLTLIPGLLVLPGCFKQRISISHTTYADRSVIPDGFSADSSFTVTGGSFVEGIETRNELLTKEVESKIIKALANKGYAVKHCLDADYCVLFNYGSKKDTQIIKRAHYIPGQSVSTTGTAYNMYGYSGQYNETTTSSGTVVYIPEQYTFYTKFLCFYIYEGKKAQNIEGDEMPPQVWYGLVLGVDQCADLRSYIDFLIIRLIDLLGKNSEGTIQLDADNELVAILRKAS